MANSSLYSAVPDESTLAGLHTYDETPVSINQLNSRYLAASSSLVEDRPYCRALFDFK